MAVIDRAVSNAGVFRVLWRGDFVVAVVGIGDKPTKAVHQKLGEILRHGQRLALHESPEGCQLLQALLGRHIEIMSNPGSRMVKDSGSHLWLRPPA